jgi:hypothetical protein
MSTGGLKHDTSPDMPTEPAEMQAASPRAAARALLGVGGMEVSMGHPFNLQTIDRSSTYSTTIKMPSAVPSDPIT